MIVSSALLVGPPLLRRVNESKECDSQGTLQGNELDNQLSPGCQFSESLLGAGEISQMFEKAPNNRKFVRRNFGHLIALIVRISPVREILLTVPIL